MLEVVAHVAVAQLEQGGPGECRRRLELLVGVRTGGEVDADYARSPAPLAPVGGFGFLDEAVLGQGAQVVAAGGGALADLGRALSGGRRALELQAGEDAQPGRVTECSERCG